jgi:hypothetical protein
MVSRKEDAMVTVHIRSQLSRLEAITAGLVAEVAGTEAEPMVRNIQHAIDDAQQQADCCGYCGAPPLRQVPTWVAGEDTPEADQCSECGAGRLTTHVVLEHGTDVEEDISWT